MSNFKAVIVPLTAIYVGLLRVRVVKQQITWALLEHIKGIPAKRSTYPGLSAALQDSLPVFWSHKTDLSALLQGWTVSVTLANCAFDGFVVIWLYFLWRSWVNLLRKILEVLLNRFRERLRMAKQRSPAESLQFCSACDFKRPKGWRRDWEAESHSSEVMKKVS